MITYLKKLYHKKIKNILIKSIKNIQLYNQYIIHKIM